MAGICLACLPKTSNLSIPKELVPRTKPALSLAGFVFFGFLMVVLSVLIDPRAVDITLIPRLLALLVFLALFACFIFCSPAARAFPVSTLRRDPVLLGYALYALLTSASLFFASNITAGWTDVFRTWGAFFVLVSTCFLLSQMPDWPAFLAKMGIISGLTSGGVGYYQLSTELGLGLHDRNELLAVTGLMSNVNLYASFLIVVLPLCLCGVVILRGLWRFAAAFVAVALFCLVVLLQTRATYLGLAGGGAATAIIVVCRWKELGLKPWVRPLLLGVSTAALISVAAFVAVADGNQIAERVRSIFSGEATTAAGGRLVIWKLTLQMAADHWWTGIGAGNFPVLLHDYFDIDNPEFSSIHPNWLQPHNDFLWVLAEKGVFGLILYLGIFISAFWLLLSSLRAGLSLDRAWMAVFVAMGLASYLIVSFFDFPMERINHQVYLALYLGMSIALGYEARGALAVLDKPSDCRLFPWVLSGAVVIIALGIAYSTAALRQEWYVIRARTNLADNDHESLVQNARLSATPWKTLDSFATPVSFLEGTGLMFLAKLDAALACFERARREMPARNYIVAHIGLLSALRKDYPRAVEAFSAALARSPENVDIKRRLADCYLEIGEIAQANALLATIPEDKVDEEVRITLAKARAKTTTIKQGALDD
jgi:O-antigen ligase